MEETKKQFEQEITLVKNLTDLNELKVKYLGKKGIITELNSKIKEIPNEEKKEYGQKINALKNAFSKLIFLNEPHFAFFHFKTWDEL